MKRICLFLLAGCPLLLVQAQKRFDSAAYAGFYQNQWEKFQYNREAAEQPVSAEEKIAGLSKCWAEAKYNFANFDLVPYLKWDSLYQSYIPKVLATATTTEYYKVLQNFYQHLHDGHTGVSFPYSYWLQKNALPPVEVRFIEGKVIVTQNTATQKEEADIQPGMEVTAINGQPIAQYILQNISPYLSFSTPQDSTERIYRYELLPGSEGSEVQLTVRTFTGKEITRSLKRRRTGRLWEPYPLVQFQVLKGNIGYLQVNSFNDEKVVHLFDSLFVTIASTKALIIDIRNNGGGNSQNGYEILGCLTDQPFYPSKSALRKFMPVGKAWGQPEQVEINGYDWKPYKGKRYNKPVVVLTGAATYSAAEDFTSAFQSMKRGAVIGSATGGSTGQPITFSLPGGGSARVCAKRDFRWDGTEFVGIGLKPDIHVQPTIKGIREGKDEVLEAAVRYLQEPKK